MSQFQQLWNCEGPIVPEGIIRARAVNCEGPIVPEGVIIRARAVNGEGPIVPEGGIKTRAVNCEGPIVPEGVIIIIVCETSSKPRQFWQVRQLWGVTAQFGVREHWRRKMAL